MGYRPGIHSEIPSDEALCAYLIGKSIGYSPNSKPDYTPVTNDLNELWHDGEPVRNVRNVRSLMRHFNTDNLHMMDLLPAGLARKLEFLQNQEEVASL